MHPIGVVRSPFVDKAEAPRQPAAARGVAGRVELLPGLGLEHALEGIEAWSHLWLVFVFHETGGRWRPKVLPPRSRVKRGVLATRSPHRPNAIGLSVVRLERVEGLVLHVLDLDLIDGTPVLDVKPYVAYADAVPEANAGWLDAPEDPGPHFSVRWSDRASEQRVFVRERTGVDVGPAVETVLAAGPEPHPYRRIRREPDGALRLAHKAWRYRFRIEHDSVVIESISTGYRARELAAPASEEIAIHRDFVERFGP